MAYVEWKVIEVQEKMTDFLHSVMDAVRHVVPIPVEVKSAQWIACSAVQGRIGVLIGITGDYCGKMMIYGDESVFSKLAERMYSVPLEGEILHSFIGELANMIAGNTAAFIFDKGRKIEITPPKVMIGQLQLPGFDKGLSVPVDLENTGHLNMILSIQNQGAV